MSASLAILRGPARRDFEAAIEFYLAEAGETVALAFLDAVEAALALIAGQPHAGSPRYSHQLQLPGVRTWPVKGFPHLIFYFASDGQLNIWRILHASRDIPTWLQAPDG